MEGKGYKEMSNRKRTGEDKRKRSKRQKEEVKKMTRRRNLLKRYVKEDERL